MVTVTVSVWVGCTVIRSSHRPRRRSGWIERAAAILLVLDDLVAEVLDGRADRHRGGGAESAERAADDVVADVEDGIQVLVVTIALLKPLDRAHQPVGALAAGRALAARLVLVELGPAERRPQHAGGGVEKLQRPGAEHRPGGAHALEVERYVQVLMGEQRGGRAAWRPELELVTGPEHAAREVDQLAQRDAQRRLVLAGVLDVAGEREDAVALGLLAAESGEPVRTLGDDGRHA